MVRLKNIFENKIDKYGNNRKQFCQNIIKSIYIPNSVVYIHIPKTAGISVSKSLFNIDSVGHYKYVDYLKYMDKEFLQSAYKFTFVRNPYDRALSAYNYLINGGRGHKLDLLYQSKLIKYRSFSDFVLRCFTNKKYLDYLHFEPQIDFLLASGKIDFDYIGKIENFNFDFDCIKRKLNRQDAIALKTNYSRKEAYDNELISDEVKQIIYKAYISDFTTLGYES